MLAAMMVVGTNRLTLLGQVIPTGQSFFYDQSFERREPVVVVTLACVVFLPLFGFPQCSAESLGPLLSRQLAGLYEPNHDRESLGLPGLGKVIPLSLGTPIPTLV